MNTPQNNQVPPRRKAVLSDVDGTLFRDSAILQVIQALRKENLIEHPGLKEVDALYTEWKRRKRPFDDYVKALIRLVDEGGLLEGLRVETIQRVSDGVQEELGDNVYLFTRELLAAARACGYLTVAVSHSPQLVLDVFNQRWKFDVVIGSEMPITEGMIQRRTQGVAPKSKMLEQHLEGLGLDTPESVAIGDTLSDVHLFDAVGHPLAFNPNRALYKEAFGRGYPLVMERKDVITLDLSARAMANEVAATPTCERPGIQKCLPDDLGVELARRLHALGFTWL